MAHAAKILNELARPKTLDDMDQRLSEIAEALTEKPSGVKPGALKDHIAITDLMMYVEMAQGQTDMKNVHEQYPATDPLTLVETARRYRVVAPETAAKLRDEFIAAVSAAAGHELTPAQIRKLHKVFRNYDPVPGMGLDA